MDDSKTKPTVPEVMPLVWALYATEHGGVGGCLHIVLDDDNVHDHHVQWCIEHARENGCIQCEHLGNLLLQMSRKQRYKLARHAYCAQYQGECRAGGGCESMQENYHE